MGGGECIKDLKDPKDCKDCKDLKDEDRCPWVSVDRP